MEGQALQPETAALVFFEQACILIDEQDRSECGFQGISPDQCKAKGCCYIIARRPDVPYCFPQHRVQRGHSGPARESSRETGSQEQQPQDKAGGDIGPEMHVSGSNAGAGPERSTPGSSDDTPDAIVVDASNEEGYGAQEKGAGGQAEEKRGQGSMRELVQHGGGSDEPVVEGDEEKTTKLPTTLGAAAQLREVMSFPTLCLVVGAAFLTGSALTVVCIGCSRSRNFGAGGFRRRTWEYHSLRVASQNCNDMDFGSSSAGSLGSLTCHKSRGSSVGSPREATRITSSRMDPIPRSSSRLSSHPQEDFIPRSSSRPGSSSPQEAGGAWTRIQVQDPI